jgi:hypothetical protein
MFEPNDLLRTGIASTRDLTVYDPLS